MKETHRCLGAETFCAFSPFLEFLCIDGRIWGGAFLWVGVIAGRGVDAKTLCSGIEFFWILGKSEQGEEGEKADYERQWKDAPLRRQVLQGECQSEQHGLCAFQVLRLRGRGAWLVAALVNPRGLVEAGAQTLALVLALALSVVAVVMVVLALGLRVPRGESGMHPAPVGCQGYV